MTDWKVGDRVEIRQYAYVDDVDTVKEITKGGNIRLTKGTRLFNTNGSLRGGGAWSSICIYKITEGQYNDYLKIKELKKRRKKVINFLNLLNDKELLVYEEDINELYDLIKD